MSQNNKTSLIPIGTFSAVTQMTQKTLRFYAEQGILPPAWIDPGNGYRYYQSVQITQARRIQMLREIGMSLSEIEAVNSAYAESPRTASKLVHKHFMNRQAEFGSVCDTYRTLILDLLDEHQADEIHRRPIAVRQEAGGPILASEHTCLMTDMKETIGRSLKRLFEAVAQADAMQRGSPFIRHFQAPDYENQQRFQVCLPICTPFTPPEGLRIWSDRPHKEVWASISPEDLDYPNYLLWVESFVEWLVRNNRIFIGFAMRSIMGPTAPHEFAWPFLDPEDEEGTTALNSEDASI